jgi:hypothetical protein
MLIVTIAALLMAASLAWFAYRLLQEEHRRSEARVAVLTAALDADPVRSRPSSPSAAGQAWALARAPRHIATNGATPHGVTRAATPDIVLLEDDSRNMRAFLSERDTARRPASTPADSPTRGVPSPDPADQLRVPLPDRDAAGSEAEASDVPTRGVGLFAEVPDARPGDARGLFAVAAVALVGLLVAAYAMFGRGSGPAATAPAARTTTAAAVAGVRPAGVPLELVALTHTQERNALVVRGRVRNPVAGSDRRVLAHVALLDGAGVVVGEADGALASERLPAGRETAFETRLAVTPAMRRYRVTFRDSAGVQVVHLDRRAAAR